MSTGATGELARYAGVSAGTIGHFRTEGFMASEIQSLVRPVRVLGTALTVSCQPTDNAPVADALGRARPGDILVIDRQGDRRHACWGGLLTLAAERAGVAAVIIDGAATDWREITELEYPVFCRNLSALTTRRLELAGSIGEPVVCGGTLVRTGDVVLGDDDGVVVLPADDASAILDEALLREAREARMRGFLDQGLPLAEARRRAIG